MPVKTIIRLVGVLLIVGVGFKLLSVGKELGRQELLDELADAASDANEQFEVIEDDQQAEGERIRLLREQVNALQRQLDDERAAQDDPTSFSPDRVLRYNRAGVHGGAEQ